MIGLGIAKWLLIAPGGAIVAAVALVVMIAAATLRRIASVLGDNVAELGAAVRITGPDGVAI